MSIVFVKIVAVFVMILMGVLARKVGLLDVDSTRRLAGLLVNLFYPALIYSSIVRNFTAPEIIANWTLPAGAVLIMVIGAAIGGGAAHIIRFRHKTEKRTFVFQSTVSNYAFLPMPLVVLIWGDKGLARLVFSTLGSEFGVWTLGIFILSGNRFNKNTMKRLLTLPMIALAGAVMTLAVRDFVLPASVVTALGQGFQGELLASLIWGAHTFGQATVPIAMVVAGSGMAGLGAADIFCVPQAVLALLRLVVVPAAVIGVLALLRFPPDVKAVLGLIAIMPTAVASVLLNDFYGGDAEFAASSVLLSHFLCLATVPLWLLLLGA